MSPAGAALALNSTSYIYSIYCIYINRTTMEISFYRYFVLILDS